MGYYDYIKENNNTINVSVGGVEVGSILRTNNGYHYKRRDKVLFNKAMYMFIYIYGPKQLLTFDGYISIFGDKNEISLSEEFPLKEDDTYTIEVDNYIKN